MSAFAFVCFIYYGLDRLAQWKMELSVKVKLPSCELVEHRTVESRNSL
jgi:hypothetical protein